MGIFTPKLMGLTYVCHPTLVFFSLSISEIYSCHKVAESEGAVHRNSLVEQWALLEGQLWRYGPKFDVGWKVVTIWMTANDVCGHCDGPVDADYLDAWSSGHDAFIHNITSNFHNVLINLVS